MLISSGAVINATAAIESSPTSLSKSHQSPMERRPIRIGRCRKAFLNAGSAGLLAGLLAGLDWGGHTPSKLLRRAFATVTPTCCGLSRFIPPVHHVASLGWLRQSSNRLMRAVRVRLQGPILS